MTSAAPGSAQSMYLDRFEPAATSGRASGPAPDHASYGSFATVSDPDWPGWYATYMVAEQDGTALPT
jgi:hypothetical protein